MRQRSLAGRERGQDREPRQEEGAGFPMQLAGQTEQDEAEAYRRHDRAVTLSRSAAAGDGEDDGGRAGHEQHIGDVAADHVADGDVGVSGEDRLNADHQLRQRRSERDKRKRHQERRDAGQTRESDRASHEKVPGHQQPDQTAEQLDQREAHA